MLIYILEFHIDECILSFVRKLEPLELNTSCPTEPFDLLIKVDRYTILIALNTTIYVSMGPKQIILKVDKYHHLNNSMILMIIPYAEMNYLK